MVHESLFSQYASENSSAGYGCEKKYEEYDSMYYQAIAYNSASNELHAIEQNNVVKIENGVPQPVASIGGLSYDVESSAVGVAPGVLSLFPLKDGSLIIVH